MRCLTISLSPFFFAQIALEPDTAQRLNGAWKQPAKEQHMSRLKKLEEEERKAEELLNKEPEEEQLPPPEEEPVEEPPEEPPPEEPPEPAVDKTETVDYWKQRFNTVEGKLKAEVPRLQAEVLQWKEHAVGLQEQINTLKEEKPPKVEPVEEPDDSMFESFAGDYPEIAKFIKTMRRDYEREIAGLKEKVDKGITTELDNVKGDIKKANSAGFDSAMTKAVPDWKILDTDPDFIEWLNTPAPYTNATKLQLLQQAASRFDADTAAQFFLDYQETLKEPEKSNLEPLVAPGQKGGATPARSGATHTGLTMKDYNRFMADSMKGTFNPKQWNGKTEAQVDAMFDNLIAKGKLK